MGPATYGWAVQELTSSWFPNLQPNKDNPPFLKYSFIKQHRLNWGVPPTSRCTDSLPAVALNSLVNFDAIEASNYSNKLNHPRINFTECAAGFFQTVHENGAAHSLPTYKNTFKGRECTSRRRAPWGGDEQVHFKEGFCEIYPPPPRSSGPATNSHPVPSRHLRPRFFLPSWLPCIPEALEEPRRYYAHRYDQPASTHQDESTPLPSAAPGTEAASQSAPPTALAPLGPPSCCRLWPAAASPDGSDESTHHFRSR